MKWYQSIIANPLTSGVQFSVDALCCTKHKVLVAHDIFSLSTTTSFIPDETGDAPLFEILHATSYEQAPKSMTLRGPT